MKKKKTTKKTAINAVHKITHNVEKIKSIPHKKIRNSNNVKLGRTYCCLDDDLPHTNKDSNKIVNVAVIDMNKNKDLAIVRLTTQESKNAEPFNPKHKLYKGFKTFIEITFQDKSKINASDKRLKENPWKNDLTKSNIEQIRNKNLHKCIQAQRNRELIKNLHKKND